MEGCDTVLRDYPPAVTPYYLSLADADDPSDPIAAQFVPCAAEERGLARGLDDPLDEAGQSPVPGLIHRYPDRVLMVVTTACFIRCRHCNRKRFWREPERAPSHDELRDMVAYVRRHAEVREVILSGGDPLTLGDERLGAILELLRGIPHVETVRIHTRAPVVLPARVDGGLTAVLARHAPVWVNTHFNHPREVTPEAARACLDLLRAGSPVGNQTVLLRGVNDDWTTIMELCRALQRIGVRPYYLFQCDQARGVEHFRTRLSAGMGIIGRLRGFTGGLAVPLYAVDLPGGGGKVVLQPEAVLEQGEESVVLRNFEGRPFTYLEPEA